MRVIPIRTPLIKPNEGVVDVLLLHLKRIRVHNGDVISISSKVAGLAEGRMIKLHSVLPHSRARLMARRYHLLSSFAQVVIDDADRVIGGVPGTLITLKNGIIVPNAGADQSNAPSGFVILWPKSPEVLAEKIRKAVKKDLHRNIGVIITDSGFIPGRRGTVGIAISVAGFDPVRDERGKLDLFRRKMRLTRVNVADSLATAAQVVSGERSERIPFVLIKKSCVSLTSKPSRILTRRLIMRREQDLFKHHLT
ncbi:MAG: coenzyme F420-0:L-glutamate ligase [Parcubacteria group bacterium]